MSTKEKVAESEPVEEDAKALEQYAREAENYISNCKKFEIDVDPSVVIALRTGWNVLKPSKSTGEGSLLPLIGILEENTHITKINLADVTMQDGRYDRDDTCPLLRKIIIIKHLPLLICIGTAPSEMETRTPAPW